MMHVLIRQAAAASLFTFLGFASCAALAQEAAPALASTTTANVEALLRNKVCLGCHQVDARRVGPPFRAIAERYAGHDGAADYLAQSIRNGGRLRWGKVPMAAQPHVSRDEAQQIAQWILDLAPAKPPESTR